MNKKILKILGVGLLLIILLGLAFLFWVNHAINTGKLVKWENEWYYADELKEKYPPQEYTVEAKNTPEEVYQEFRQALLDGDKEKALEYIVEEKRDEYREAFKNEENFNNWVNRLPKEIIKESLINNNASFYYLNAENESDKVAHPINFVKDKDGYWKIYLV